MKAFSLQFASLFFTDIRLDWASYNVQPQDTQLLDMLVFFGQPLPLFKNGEEVIPVAREDDSFGNEETPFIQVMLKEHDGERADRPFDVTPRQQVCHASPVSDESGVCHNNLSRCPA